MTRQLQRFVTLFALLCIAAASRPALGAGASTQPDELKQQLKDAYGAIKTYQGTAHVDREIRIGRQARKKSGDYSLAFDRAAHKLAIDTPDYWLIADGKKVRFGFHGLQPDKFVEIDQPESLDYESLASYFPVFKGVGEIPPQPEVMLLLSENPYRNLCGQQPDFSVAPAQNAGRNGLVLDSQQSTFTLWIDPKTHLVTQTTEAKKSTVSSPDMSNVWTFTITPKSVNGKVADGAFAADIKSRRAVDSFDALFGRQPLQEDRDELQGQTAPKLPVTDENGKQVDVLAGKQDVIVLDFWATWCGPCLMWLPEVQKISDWAKKEKLNVAIYAVSLGDKPADVKKMWEREGLSLPVVYLNDNGAAQTWGLEAIPRTVVIVDGKMAIIHTGVSAGAGPQLQQQIADVLKKKAAASRPAE